MIDTGGIEGCLAVVVIAAADIPLCSLVCASVEIVSGNSIRCWDKSTKAAGDVLIHGIALLASGGDYSSWLLVGRSIPCIRNQPLKLFVLMSEISKVQR